MGRKKALCSQKNWWPLVLHRMEDNGWIKSRWVEVENGRKRKYYSIKKDGHHALKEKREQWAVIAAVLRGLWKEKYV